MRPDPLAPEQPVHTPQVREILEDLGRQAKEIESVRATRVRVVVKAPTLAATQILPQSSMQYRAPADLHVIGRKLGGMRYVEITAAQGAFLLDLPVEREYYYRAPGQTFEAGTVQVSPADIVRELFQPEDWAQVGEAWLLEQDADGESPSLILELPETARGPGLFRTVRVGYLAGRWVLLESHLIDELGVVLATTTWDEYTEREGVLFPLRMEARFPTEDAFMRFEISAFSLNEPLDSEPFDIEAILPRLQRERYTEREPYDGY